MGVFWGEYAKREPGKLMGDLAGATSSAGPERSGQVCTTAQPASVTDSGATEAHGTSRDSPPLTVKHAADAQTTRRT